MIGIEVCFEGAFHGSVNPNRDVQEWPPSPDRFYQSLVASHYAMSGVEDLTEKDREALLWLEKQSLPDIIYSDGISNANSTFVPTQALSTKVYPDRQKRTFVAFRPRHPKIYYVWPDSTINEHWGTIGKVLSYYSHLGTSRSFASAKLILDLPDLPEGYTRITPDEDGDLIVPAYYPDRLNDLDWCHAGNILTKRPTVRYREVLPDKNIHPGLFKGFHVYQMDGGFIRAVQSAEVASQFRLSLLKAMSSAGHELSCVIGREMDKDNHLAYIPLIYAGSDFSDGSIRGLGVGIPHGIDPSEEMAVRRLLSTITTVKFRDKDLSFARSNAKSITLSASRWSRPSTVWATVTPMEIQWSNKRSADQRQQVLRFCEWAKLPTPSQVEIRPEPWFRGSDFARYFLSPNAYKQRPQGFLTHVRLSFDVPVRGPVVLGRGGNFGVGVFSQVWPERMVG